jgi:hypothetical protein
MGPSTAEKMETRMEEIAIRMAASLQDLVDTKVV